MAVSFISVISSTIFLSIFAVAVSLNFRIARFLNLSHGSIYALGGYISFFTFSLHFNAFLGFLTSAVFSFITGAILFLLVKKIGKNLLEATIISLGFGIGLEEILRLTNRTGYYLIIGENVIPTDLRENLNFLIFLLVFFFLLAIYRSQTGIKLKFIEEDSTLAEIYGVNTEKYALLCTGFTSSIIASLGFINSTSQAIFPAIGWSPLISGILIAAFASIFRTTGFLHYLRISAVALVYSLILSFII